MHTQLKTLVVAITIAVAGPAQASKTFVCTPETFIMFAAGGDSGEQAFDSAGRARLTYITLSENNIQVRETSGPGPHRTQTIARTWFSSGPVMRNGIELVPFTNAADLPRRVWAVEKTAYQGRPFVYQSRTGPAGGVEPAITVTGRCQPN